MAFRFRREGDYVKHRVKMSQSGMQPWVNDFKYRVVDWHYQFYMRDQARRAINSNQLNAERTQTFFDSKVGNLQMRKGLSDRTVEFSEEVVRYFNWRPFVPNVVPHRANSNPFCPVTPNKTGWKESPKRRLTDPQPMGGHAIAGTDDSVPIFPKFRGKKLGMSSSPRLQLPTASNPSSSASPRLAASYPIQSSLDEGTIQQVQATLAMNLASYEMEKDLSPNHEAAFALSQFTKEKNYSKELEVNAGIKVQRVMHNAPTPVLYEEALRNEEGSYITSTGALAVSSGAKTGRSPGDKRIVEAENLKDIWWGKVNIPMSAHAFMTVRERAIDYLNTREQLYVVDAFAGWDKEYRIRVRIITTRAYHALFMQNMLVLPTEEEQANFVPEFVIYNAGCFPANKYSKGLSSSTCIALSFERREMVVLGTEYAGEMKKGILTLMMYEMPRLGQLCLHSSATLGLKGDVTLFFGLSGTGKTTLSADPKRRLIGDDEHVWTDKGVFNVEGGCYAKAINLTRENEPEVFDCITFSAVLENVCFDATTRVVDYTDTSLTENTRAAYPLDLIPNAVIPAVVDSHPQAIVLLCCDAFGVIPPVSLLSFEQVEYYFVSGYTAKVAGTEQGVKEPTATFSPCFAGPFLVHHPMVYAELLSNRLKQHSAKAYLINTGWVGGAYGVGKRCPLKYTRKIVDAINEGLLVNVQTRRMEVFNLDVPVDVPGVPQELLYPRDMWKDENAFDAQVRKLAGLFQANFREYESRCPPSVKAAGPQLG